MTLHPLVQFFLEATYHRPPGIWTIWLYLGSGRRSVYLWKLLLVVVGHILICLPAHWPKHIHGYMRKWKFLQKMQPEFNDLKHVDPTDQVQPIVPTRSHHGREQLVHQLLYNIYIIYHLYHITSSYCIRIISYISIQFPIPILSIRWWPHLLIRWPILLILLPTLLIRRPTCWFCDPLCCCGSTK